MDMCTWLSISKVFWKEKNKNILEKMDEFQLMSDKFYWMKKNTVLVHFEKWANLCPLNVSD